MGMDVYGKKPKNKEGEYFPANVWSWRPLAMLLEHLFGEYTEKIEYLHTNDGDGLEAEDAMNLGLEMINREEEIRRWIDRFNAEKEALADQTCQLCEGTGIRTDEVGIEHGLHEKTWVDEDGNKRTGWCNACQGKGSHRPIDSWYGIEFDHVMEFAKFAVNSGGFEIW